MKRIHSQSYSIRIDSIHQKFKQDSTHTYRAKKLRPYFALDSRRSWIENIWSTKRVPISINGFQAGVILFEKHKMGYGLYNISAESTKDEKITDKLNQTRYQRLLLNYLTMFYEYTIFDSRYFELSLPLEIGSGRYIYYLINDTKSVILRKEDGKVRLTGGGAAIELKPFKWIGVQGMLGFRAVAFTANSNLNLSGFYYSYGIWVDFRQIYRDIKFYGFQRPKYRRKLNSILASKG